VAEKSKARVKQPCVATEEPSDAGESDAPGERPAGAFRALPAAARAPLRLLAPFLASDGSGIQARLPFDIEIR
jgi:hypothetical protein